MILDVVYNHFGPTGNHLGQFGPYTTGQHRTPWGDAVNLVLKLAERIAAKPSFALKLTKEAVNRSVDVMGQPAAIEQAFALHQLCHAHNLQEFGMVVDPSGLHPSVRKPATAK